MLFGMLRDLHYRSVQDRSEQAKTPKCLAANLKPPVTDGSCETLRESNSIVARR